MFEQVAEWPDRGEKHAGDYVENVHPCNRGRYPVGLVVYVETIGAHDAAFVRIGKGSTVYGPAEHWRVTDEAPAWLEQLEGVA